MVPKLIPLFLAIFTIYLTVLTTSSSAIPAKESVLISEPQPGQEFVQLSAASPPEQKEKKTILLKVSTAGTRKAFTKEKSSFETAHKIPVTLKEHDEYVIDPVKGEEIKKHSSHKSDVKNVKRHAEAAAEPVDPPHPAAIKIDPLKLIAKYRSELEISKESTTPNSMLTTGSPSTQRSLEIKSNNKKSTGGKKSNIHARSVDGKVSSTLENGQRSRIEIKKGPNGQDYEYEYVYYYYDDDDANSATGKDSKAHEKVNNSHDGPRRNSITSTTKQSGRNKYTAIERSTTEQPEPASNEVVPSIRSSTRQRGRQLPNEPAVEPERLPANTRFPPRSRTLSTTPTTTTEEPTTKAASRSRQRGRPQTSDNVADESNTSNSSNNQNTVTRTRGRSNVRRPSLELVDSASFKTHASDVSVSQYKDLPNQNDDTAATKPNFPAQLPEGPMRFLGATNERMDTSEEASNVNDDVSNNRKNTATGNESDEDNRSTSSPDTTTTESGITTTLSDDMNAAMDKVALDLYAILQGTQNMMEDTEQDSTTDADSILTTEDTTGNTSEYFTTEEITTPTTTTTTTTTTPAPTTTTTTEPSTTAATGRNRFRARGSIGSNRFKSSPTKSTTEATSESTSSKPKSRFGSSGRTSGFGGRTRINPRTTTTESTVVESDISKEEAKPVSHSRPSIGSRSRFGTASRSRFTTTTTATPGNDGESSAPATSVTRSSFTRPRPNFNLKRRGGVSTTQATSETPPADQNENHNEQTEEKQEKQETTTARTIRGRPGGNSLVKPLRPGARININSRGRLGAVTTSTTTTAPEKLNNDEASSDESNVADEDSEKKTETTPAPVNESPLTRLRNRARLSISPKAKTPATTPTPIARRANPLINRRRPIGSSIPSSTEAVIESHEESTDSLNNEDSTAISEKEDGAKEVSVSSTTEAEHPRGLSSLLAGRKRLVNRRPGTIL